MADLATVVPAGLALFGSGWAGQAVLAWMKNRGEQAARKEDSNVKLTEHSSKLMFEVLEAARVDVQLARAEAKAARTENASLRSMEGRFAHFEEALDHIKMLIAAEGAEEVRAARRRATAFLNRMRRLADARGTILNELQLQQSTEVPDVPEDMKATLRKLDGEKP